MSGYGSLPLCPRPLPREAFRSWLCRVGAVYAMTPEDLLTALALKAPNMPLDHVDLVGLSRAARLPIGRIAELASASEQWTLRDSPCVAVCMECLHDDLLNNVIPHLRRAWLEAWCVLCVVHGSRLQIVLSDRLFPRYRKHVTAAGLARLSRQHGAREPDGDAIDGGVRRAIQVTQDALSAALSGRPPHAPTWGILQAADFLTIIDDLTSWARSNFELTAAYPPIHSLPIGLPGATSALFSPRRRPLLPWRTGGRVQTLASVVDPAARAAALWWAYALAADADPTTGLRLESEPRQTSFLESRAPEGLAWLWGRMARWPASYVSSRWGVFTRSRQSAIGTSRPLSLKLENISGAKSRN